MWIHKGFQFSKSSKLILRWSLNNIKCFVHICLFLFQPQYLIYEKLKIEGFTDSHDGDVTLTIEMFVPSSQVGRIIGKGGTNVRELQRLTGAIIKLPEQLSPPPKDETSVVIIGKWIQALVSWPFLHLFIRLSTSLIQNMDVFYCVWSIKLFIVFKTILWHFDFETHFPLFDNKTEFSFFIVSLMFSTISSNRNLMIKEFGGLFLIRAFLIERDCM